MFNKYSWQEAIMASESGLSHEQKIILAIASTRMNTNGIFCIPVKELAEIVESDIELVKVHLRISTNKGWIVTERAEGKTQSCSHDCYRAVYPKGVLISDAKEQHGWWMPFSKSFRYDLPVDRNYTPLEAAFLVQLDFEEGRERSPEDYSDILGWEPEWTDQLLKNMCPDRFINS